MLYQYWADLTKDKNFNLDGNDLSWNCSLHDVISRKIQVLGSFFVGRKLWTILQTIDVHWNMCFMVQNYGWRMSSCGTSAILVWPMQDWFFSPPCWLSLPAFVLRGKAPSSILVISDGFFIMKCYVIKGHASDLTWESSGCMTWIVGWLGSRAYILSTHTRIFKENKCKWQRD